MQRKCKSLTRLLFSYMILIFVCSEYGKYIIIIKQYEQNNVIVNSVNKESIKNTKHIENIYKSLHFNIHYSCHYQKSKLKVSVMFDCTVKRPGRLRFVLCSYMQFTYMAYQKTMAIRDYFKDINC